MATTAALVARARRNVIGHFLKNDSVSPARAILCVPNRGREQRALDRLVEQGVIVRMAPETYYLNAPAYERWQQQLRRKMIAAVVVLIILAFALGAIVR